MSDYQSVKQKDINFLTEYANFSCKAPVVAGDTLYSGFEKYYDEKDYNSVAYLLLKLHSEFVLMLESAGGLLHAISKWDAEGGIFQAFSKYIPNNVRDIFKRIKDEDDILEILRLPKVDKVLELYKEEDPEQILKEYSNTAFKEALQDLSRMYLEGVVTKSYNKIKHGGLIFRDPRLAESQKITEKILGKGIFVSLKKKKPDDLDLAYFPVTGQESKDLAYKYKKNIRSVSEIIERISRLVAYFMDQGLYDKK